MRKLINISSILLLILLLISNSVSAETFDKNITITNVNINITPAAVGSPIDITSGALYPQPNTFEPGQTITFVYNINNPTGSTLYNYVLGAQIRTNSPQGTWIDDNLRDPNPPEPITPGTKDYSRTFIIRTDVPTATGPGLLYDANWVIYNKITNVRSDTETYLSLIRMVPTTIIAEASGPYSGNINTPISFSGSASGGAYPYTSYSWNFGDGYTGSGQYPSHAYTSAGTYTVYLTVTNSVGHTGQDTATVTVTATQIIPEAYGPYSGYVNAPISFSGSASGGTGSYSSYSWNFGDSYTGSGQYPSHTYTSTGTKYVTLTVTDSSGNSGQDTATVTVSAVANQPPHEPTDLYQYKSDGTTGIPLGGTTSESTVVMKGGVSDPNSNNVLLEVEIRPVGTTFTNIPTCSGSLVSSGGTASATCSGLADREYHWQARASEGTSGLKGPWKTAGGNPESNTDFIVSTQITERSLLQVEGNINVYWFQNNKLYWVTESAMTLMSVIPGWGWDKVKVYPSSVFNPASYVNGPRFINVDASSDNLLIREYGAFDVYLISGGKRRHIVSPEVFESKGYNWADVINVSSQILNLFPNGTDISNPPSVTITAPTDGSTVTTSTVTVTGTATDDIGVTSLTVNGNPVALNSGSFSTTVNLISGANPITVTAKDAEDNSNTKTVTVTYVPNQAALRILASSVYPNVASPGDTLDFVYSINNPGTTNVNNVRLGARIRTNSPQGIWIDDKLRDKVEIIYPGTRNYNRSYKVNTTVSLGLYDAQWVILDNADESKWFDNRTYSPILTIQSNQITEKSLLQVEGSIDVYWLQNKKLYWVTEAAMTPMSTIPGWKWSDVKVYPSSVFNPASYVKGPRFINVDATSDNLLIKEYGASKVYLISGGKKRYIVSQAVFEAKGYNWADVIDVSSIILNLFPIGSDISNPPSVTITAPTDGSTVTTSTVTVTGTATDDIGVTSLTVNGKAVALTSGSFSTTVNLVSGANTITVTAKDAGDNIKTATVTVTYGSNQVSEKSLLRVDGKTEVYWLQNHKLYWVTDWDVITKMSGIPGWGSVNVLPASVFIPAAYAQGPRFVNTDAISNDLLIQEKGKTEVYLISGGKRHHIVSEEVFLSKGYKFADVIEVSSQILNIFPIGSDISNPSSVTNLANNPSSPKDTDTVNLYADVVSVEPISSVSAQWSTDHVNWNIIDMIIYSGNTYITSSRVPSQNGGTIIYYKISAISSGGSTLSSENSYSVQSTTTVLTVSISSPASNSNFNIGNSVTFTANAQGGTAPYTNYVWRSNIDGEIGRGETINVKDLSMGQHKITISVTDSLGKVATGSVNIIISIGANAPIINTIKTNAWGYFIEGVDAYVNVGAVVSDPDGNGDIQKVIFTVNGNNYVDTNGADGWGNTINVGGLNNGDILSVTAHDKEGHKSVAKTLQIKTVKIPWLLSPFIETNINNGDILYSFSGDLDLASIGDSWSSTTPKNYPIFSGYKNTINPPNVAVSGLWSTSGRGEVSISMDINIEFLGDKTKWRPKDTGVVRDITKTMLKNFASGKYSYCKIYPNLCVKRSRYMGYLDIEVGGYGEVVFKDEIMTPEQISAFLNISYEHTIPWPGASLNIPWIGNQGVFVKVGPRGKIEGVYGFSNNKMSLSRRTIEFGSSVELEGKLGDEEGDWMPGYVEVYAIGDFNVIIVSSAPEYINNYNLCLSSMAGAKARLGWNFLGYSKDEKIGPFKYPEGCQPGNIMQGLSSYSFNSIKTTNQPIENVGNWKWEMMRPAPTPLYQGSVGIASIEMTPSKPEDTIIYDDMPDDFPAVAAEKNGGAWAVWVHGTNISVMPPKMSIYYSNLNGSWSDPAPIHTDNTLVLNPQVAYYGNGAVAVWTGDKGTLDINSSFDAWLSTLEIYYSFWNGSSWTTPGKITNDTEGDGQPSIATDGMNITAVWVHDSDSNISTKNDLDIHYSILNSTNWSSPSALTSDNLQDYGSKVAQQKNGSALSVWTRDTDGNSSTDEDKEILYSFWNGAWTAPAQLTGNAWKDSKSYPVFKGDTPAVIWVQSKNVSINTSLFNETSNMTEYIDVNISTDSVMFSEFKNNLWTAPHNISTEDFSISDTVLSEDGFGNLIAAWRGYNNGNGDITYTVRDAASRIWSTQKKLVNDSMVNWKLSMDVSSNRSIFVWLKHNSTIVSDSNGMRLESEYDDVFYSVLDIKPDLAISAEDIEFSSDFRINDTIPVNFTVRNEGVIGSESFTIKVYNGTPVVENQIASIRSDSIVGGGSLNFSINYYISNFTSSIQIIIDTSNEVAELNEINNAAYREIKVLPDLAISPDDFSINSNGTGEYKLDLGIRNIGGINATNVPLKIYDDYPPNGTLLYSGSQDISTDGTHVVISLNLTNGTHFLYAIINSENSIVEIDMTNNEAGYYLKILPDLIISTPRVSFNSNGTATINVTVRNIGFSNASNISVAIFDDTSSLTSFNNETILHRWEINNLELNEHRSISASIDFTGINKILLVADINNTIAEIDEFNNMVSGNLIFPLITSTISLKTGWNLISVPLNLMSWKLGDEATVGKPINVTPANSISSLYQYNTTSALFEKSDHFADWGWWPATGSESFTALEPGRGYWAMAQQDCSLTFTGTAPSDLDIPLNSGWNLIGWYSMNEAPLGNESVVGNPLNVTPANSLTSIYRYNTTSAVFEKSDHFPDWGWWPATGSEGFTKLESGRGYWVMAQNGAGWS